MYVCVLVSSRCDSLASRNSVYIDSHRLPILLVVGGEDCVTRCAIKKAKPLQINAIAIFPPRRSSMVNSEDNLDEDPEFCYASTALSSVERVPKGAADCTDDH